MTTRTTTMLMNDFGINRQQSSPWLRLMRPRSYAVDAVVAIAEALIRAIERTFEAVETWYRKQRTYRDLAQLDDHVLRDIGLTRDSIPSRIAELEAERRRQLRAGRRI